MHVCPKKTCSRLTFTALLLFMSCCWQPLFAQQLEYAAHPDRPFDFREIHLDLQINPADSVILGRADYRLKSFWDHTDRLILDAHRIDVQRITIDKQTAKFELHNDSLIIHFPQPVNAGREVTMQIVYEAEPDYAWQTTGAGLVFSSFFPERRAYLFPIIDNPHVLARFVTDITAPDSLQAVTNGRLSGEDTVRQGMRTSHWVTAHPIPVTGWGMVLGRFDQASASVDSSSVHLYVYQGLLTKMRRQKLVEDAVHQITAISAFIGDSLPFSPLNIVVLPDHRWEMKTYGAGYGYLFMNMGNLEAQLHRLIAAQWAGVRQRSSRFMGADSQIMLQAWLAARTGATSADTLSLRNSPSHDPAIYAAYSVKNWNRWLHYFQDSSGYLRQIIDQQMPEMLNKRSGVFDWPDYERIWYRERGKWLRLPVPAQAGAYHPPHHNIVYQVDYHYQSGAGKLSLYIRPVQGYSMELMTLPIIMTGADTRKRVNITFSGVGDTVSVQAVPSLKNVYMQVPDSLHMTLVEHKPVSFWLYQLRTNDNVARKLQAIRALGLEQQNPDLQLFLLDFLKHTQDPSLRAALIVSLGRVTNGATGTSQVFLKALSDSSDSVRAAAAGALSHYPGNDQVVSSLEQRVLGDPSRSVRVAALQALQQVDPADRYLVFIKELVREKKAEPMAAIILPGLIQNGDTTAALALAQKYVTNPGPFAMRWKSLKLLQQNKGTVDNWDTIITDMIQDNDPRIRFLGWIQANYLTDKEQQKLIGRYAPDENDARVINQIRKLKGNGSRTIIRQE